MRIALVLLVLLMIFGVGASVALAQTETPTPTPTATPTPVVITTTDPFVNGLIGGVAALLQSLLSAISQAFGPIIQLITSIGLIINNAAAQGNEWAAALVERVDSIRLSLERFIFPVFDFIVFVVENFGEIIAIAALAVSILISILWLIAGWAWQVIVVIAGIFAGILGAPPAPLPGLPRCITAPMESQVCAAWYIFDYTVFADGTPGQYIITLIVFGIDIIILFYVAKAFVRVGKLFEGISDVS